MVKVVVKVVRMVKVGGGDGEGSQGEVVGGGSFECRVAAWWHGSWFGGAVLVCGTMA